MTADDGDAAYRHPLLDLRNRLKERLTDPTARAYGIFVLTADSALTEACGVTNLDWVVLDMEAGPISRRDIQHGLQALTGSRCTAIVRVPALRCETIEHVLDLGAHGVLVPKVDNAEQAVAAAAACRFAPDGTRGINPVRASGYLTDVPTYLRRANARTMCLVQIESAHAVEDVDRIAKVDGVDGLFIGTGDLASSLGQPGDVTGPAMDAARAAILTAAHRHGKIPGIFAYSMDLARQYVDEGFRLVAVGNEIKIFKEALVNMLATLPATSAT